MECIIDGCYMLIVNNNVLLLVVYIWVEALQTENYNLNTSGSGLHHTILGGIGRGVPIDKSCLKV